MKSCNRAVLIIFLAKQSAQTNLLTWMLTIIRSRILEILWVLNQIIKSCWWEKQVQERQLRLTWLWIYFSKMTMNQKGRSQSHRKFNLQISKVKRFSSAISLNSSICNLIIWMYQSLTAKLRNAWSILSAPRITIFPS